MRKYLNCLAVGKHRQLEIVKALCDTKVTGYCERYVEIIYAIQLKNDWTIITQSVMLEPLQI